MLIQPELPQHNNEILQGYFEIKRKSYTCIRVHTNTMKILWQASGFSDVFRKDLWLYRVVRKCPQLWGLNDGQ